MDSSHSEHEYEDDHGGAVHVHEEHEGGHDEPWLVSYADMMTLLFGFFVIMYSYAAAKNDEQDWFKMKKEVATYFGGEYINPVDKVATELSKAVSAANISKDVQIKVQGDMLDVIVQSKAVFESGSAEIIKAQIPLLGKLFDVIKQNDLKNYQVVIEGHTDDVPIQTLRFRSNWDLSSARAATVAMMLQDKQFDARRISVRAFGEFKPLFPNLDDKGQPIEENRAKNRRIEIKLIADKV